MTSLNQLAKKAFYLGVGLASYAGEKATNQWQELRTSAQALADELVTRGELKAEEASQFVDELLQQAQQGAAPTDESENREPRRIEIITDEDETAAHTSGTNPDPNNIDQLRSQVEELQARLRELQQ